MYDSKDKMTLPPQQDTKPSVFHARWILLAPQLIATLIVLAFVPGNANKLILFVVIWVFTFQRLSLRELLCYVGVCALFSIMNIMATRQGVFQFLHPDLAGLPVWEYFTWGFYVLHILRMLGGPKPSSRFWVVLSLAILFALPFSTVSDPFLLLATSGFGVALALIFFHDHWDLSYVAYTLLVGAAIEYAGVWSGQWYYPGNPSGGVAFWFVTMWGGIGLFIRRLVLPLVAAAPRRLDQNSDISR